MVLTIFDQIREDAQKGARGPWTFEIETGDWPDQYLIDGNGDPVLEWDFDLGFCISAPNARRIVRVPQLERIALAAEELAPALQCLLGYLEGLIEDGCPQCGGDCAGANPPLAYCTMREMNNDLAKCNAALAKLREASK